MGKLTLCYTGIKLKNNLWLQLLELSAALLVLSCVGEKKIEYLRSLSTILKKDCDIEVREKYKLN